MFCAIATTIDRCKTEGVVDVFQVVKASGFTNQELCPCGKIELIIICIVYTAYPHSLLFDGPVYMCEQPYQKTHTHTHTHTHTQQENYRSVFEAILVFLDSFDTYANFQ